MKSQSTGKILKTDLSEINAEIGRRINSGHLEKVEALFRPELGYEALILDPDLQIYIHQLWIARVTQMMGAYEGPLRISGQILKALRTHEDYFQSKDLLRILVQLAAIFFESSSFSGILKIQEIISSLQLVDSTSESSIFITYFDALLLQAQLNLDILDFDPTIQNDYEELKEKAASHKPLQDTIEFQLCTNLFATRADSQNELMERIERNKRNTTPSIVPFYNHLLAKIHLQNKNASATKSFLEMDQNKISFLTVENLFIKKYGLGESLTVSEEALLHCFPGVNDYSFLLGNRYLSMDYKLSSLFKNQLPTQSSNWPSAQDKVWILAPRDSSSDNFLNLESGHLFLNGQSEYLGRNKSVALMTIIGMGPLGASLYQISEKVYADEIILPEMVRTRTTDLIKNIQRKSLPLRKQGSHFTFDFSSFPGTIYFPKDHTFKGELVDLYKSHTKISKNLIGEQLQVSTRTAGTYIQEWKAKKLIERRSTEYGVYFFNDTEMQSHFKSLQLERFKHLDI